MAAPTTDAAGDTTMNEPSPGHTQHDGPVNTDQLRKAIATFDDHHSDPDAQTTVTDFLDFTEYLPSDIIRSLTLIEKHDHTYTASSSQVHDLTKIWGQLPSLQAKERPSPVQLRADISEQLSQAVSSRVFAHAEALRMSKNVDRHYNKAKLLLSKLQTMMENYPTDEQQAQSPSASRSPHQARAKVQARPADDGESKVRQKRMPKIIVPGEVLAPYDIDYDTFTDGTDVSTDNDDDDIPASVRKPVSMPRSKGGAGPKAARPANRASRPASTHPASAEAVAAQAAALLNPPPANAVIGSADAPWLQLTEYELAKLRKRMKKNATWTPSDTMVARELRTLGRGPEDFIEAQKKAKEEGRPFEPEIPPPVAEDESGTQALPAGAISVDSAAAADDDPMSTRGLKLNVARKLKRETLAKMAAEEAEESARRMTEAAKLLLGNSGPPSGAPSESPKDMSTKSVKTRSNAKRKRDTELKADSEPPDGSDSSSLPAIKRTKTETPVPPPVHVTTRQPSPQPNDSVQPQEGEASSATSGVVAHAETPVPLPLQNSTNSNASGTAKLRTPTPGPTTTALAVDQTDVSPTTLKPPVLSPAPTPTQAIESSITLPRSDRRKSITPTAPALRELPAREVSRRETRGDAAKRTQQQQQQQLTIDTAATQIVTNELNGRRSSSRGVTPGKSTPTVESAPIRRPVSRGKSAGQEPQPSLAADRARRTSTARNTPAPEARPPVKRTKRPAPGVVSTTNSGGNSAVGKRKAAPRKKARATRKEKDQQVEEEMEDVDDEGNPIDPSEPRYCICNRVSFGTMIQCDNIENCKHEWFHLECVDLEDIPARTTKWYCPDCRKVLNIGEKGEVSARGVRK